MLFMKVKVHFKEATNFHFMLKVEILQKDLRSKDVEMQGKGPVHE